jgi:hypothetical protein
LLSSFEKKKIGARIFSTYLGISDITFDLKMDRNGRPENVPSLRSMC